MKKTILSDLKRFPMIWTFSIICLTDHILFTYTNALYWPNYNVYTMWDSHHSLDKLKS